MLAWSPVLIQKIEIHALGFVLRQLQLHRHRVAEISLHRHPYAQLILYLSGEGVQSLRGRRHPARAGDLFIIPRGLAHGFAVSGQSRPLCLVLDYQDRGGPRSRAVHRRLDSETLNELHRLLAQLPTKGRLTLAHYPIVLAVIARLLDPRAGATAPRPEPTLYEKVNALIRSPEQPRVAPALGLNPDYLNRKLKREAGLGLRALRDRIRLEKAEAALRTAPSVAAAAVAAGFEDPNYFTRWFREKSQMTPSEWRRRKLRR